MSRQVTKAQSVAMFSEDKPAFMGEGERGQENVGLEDLSIPRVDIIQSLSPQRKKNDPAYIEGAEEGLIFNNVTSRIYGNVISFVPVYYRKEWLLWKLQSEGGGFCGAYPNEQEARNEMAVKGLNPEQHEIVDTAQQFGLVVMPDGQIDEVVLSMAKSKMKVNRQLNTMIKMSGGDRFSRAYELKAVQVNGPKGDYYNFNVRSLGYISEELYHQAEKLYEAISVGQRDVNREYDAPATEGEEEY